MAGFDFWLQRFLQKNPDGVNTEEEKTVWRVPGHSSCSGYYYYLSFVNTTWKKLIEPLDKWERLTIADAVQAVAFQDGEVVLEEGEQGEDFYIIVKG